MRKIPLFLVMISLGIAELTFAQTPIVPTGHDLDKMLVPHAADCPTVPAKLPKALAPTPIFVPLADPNLQLLGTPNANLSNAAPRNNCHQGILDAIQNAKASIHMTMFHLTDQAIIQALVAAQKKNIDVQVILDPSSPNLAQMIATLKAANITATQSSPCYNMTHEKALVIDASPAAQAKHLTPTSIIGAMNMTGDNQNATAKKDLTEVCESTRDFDITTHDAQVASDVSNLFSQDYQNATANPPIAKGACPAVTLKSPSLVLSPDNSEAKLVSLIQSSYDPKTTAKIKNKTIQCTAENWGDQNIQQALVTAAQNGVNVQIIAPMCDQNPDPSFNFDRPVGQAAPATLQMLLGQKNITVKAMPAPPENSQPYMHSKMCRINDSTTYVGSVNFSHESTSANRELGIIFNSSAKAGSAGQQIDQAFNQDFKTAQVVPNPVPANYGNCPKPPPVAPVAPPTSPPVTAPVTPPLSPAAP